MPDSGRQNNAMLPRAPLRILVPLFPWFAALAFAAAPAGFNYDEAAVRPYRLPDPLVMKDGSPVRDAATWRTKRRPELLELFAENVYGRTPAGRPPGMHWQVTSVDRAAL